MSSCHCSLQKSAQTPIVLIADLQLQAALPNISSLCHVCKIVSSLSCDKRSPCILLLLLSNCGLEVRATSHSSNWPWLVLPYLHLKMPVMWKIDHAQAGETQTTLDSKGRHPSKRIKVIPPSRCLNGATCWHGPSHKLGCLWRRRVAEDCRGSWESLLLEKTPWHLFSKQCLSGFMLRGNEDLGVIGGSSVVRRCWWRLTSFMRADCTRFIHAVSLCETPNLTLWLCQSVSWGRPDCLSPSIAEQHGSLTGYSK